MSADVGTSLETPGNPESHAAFPTLPTLGIFLGAGIVLVVFVIAFVGIGMVTHLIDLETFMPNPLPIGLMCQALSYVPLLGYFYAVTPALSNVSWRQLGLRVPRVSDLLFAAGVGATIGFVDPLFHLADPGSDRWISSGPNHSIVLASYLATALLFGPLTEEIIFRVILGGWLRSHTPLWITIGISALVFAAAHGVGKEFVSLTLLGIALGLIYLKTKNLWPAVAGHIFYNVVGVIVSLQR